VRLSVLTAAATARDLTRRVFALSAVWKAAKKKPNPLSPAGFDAYVLQLLTELSDVVGPVEAAAAKEFSSTLQRQWAGLTPRQREAAIQEAKTKYLSGVKAVPDMLFGTLQSNGKEISGATREANVNAHALKIQPSLSIVDEASVNALSAAQSLYVTDSQKNIAEELSTVARSIVADGLRDGLDDYDISKALAEALPLAALGRTQSYLRMISATFIARARTSASLNSFTEAGAGAYQIIAVVDELSCEPCRFMHGRVFGVAASVAAQAAANEDPAAVKDTLPWMYVAKDGDNGKAIFTKVGGQKVKVAGIAAASGGKNDAIGRYSSALSSKQMSAMGIGAPPFHGQCRCVLTPVFGGAPVRARGPAPAETVDQDGDIEPQAAPVIGRPGKPVPPAKLPDNIADLVRPLPKYRDYETPGSFTPKPAPEVAWKMKLSQLPEIAAPFVAPPGTNISWSQHTLDTQGAAAPIPKEFFGKIHPKTLEKLDKSPKTFVPFTEINKIGGNGLGVSANDALKLLDGTAAPWLAYVQTKTPILYKKDGKYWYPTNYIYGDHTKMQATVEFAKGAEGHSFAIYDLDEKGAKAAAKKPKKPKVMPATPVPPPPPPPPPQPPQVTLGDPTKRTQLADADNILKTKDGNARGSNSGGFYVGNDGVRRYVKFYDDEAQVWCEHLANNIYSDLGLGAPSSEVFKTNGKLAYSSRIFDGGKTLSEVGVSKDRAKKFAEGFVADILTGNWDAVGLSNDNAMELKDGKIVRIDNGGTFLFRAKAGRKPASVLNEITEWDVFLSPTNPSYSSLMAKAGYNSHVDAAPEIIKGIQTIKALEKREGGWRAYVDKVAWGLPDGDKEKVVAMLEARSKLLSDKEAWLKAELTKPKPVPPAPGEARYIAPQYSTVLPRKGLKLADLPEMPVLEKEKAKTNGDKLADGESARDYRKRIEASCNYTGATRRAVIDFSGSAYTPIRNSEAAGNPTQQAIDIHGAFKQGTSEPGTVFRGINVQRDFSRNETREAFEARLKSTIESYLENPSGLFQLGYKLENGVAKFADGTSSSSWKASVAESFMGGASNDPTDGDGLKIFYKFNARNAMPIEHVSKYEYEKERLLRHDSVWRITGLSRLPGKRNILVVESEEVVPEDAQKGTP
jgi:hypothetical protein